MSKQSKTAGKTAEAAHCAEGKKYELTVRYVEKILKPLAKN